MANRHLSRSIVLQTLFEWDSASHGEISFASVREALRRNIDEFAPGSSDEAFMDKLARGVLEKKADLDTIITKAAPEWPLEKIAPIDRNILRIGLYELLFADRNEVPAKVAINEAIELGKNFGGDNSGRFINGVLGAVYKEIGEPGKHDIAKKKIRKDVPFEKMPIERKVGAVVFAKEGEEVYVALVHDVFGHWTLPKGKVEEGIEPSVAVLKEIKDEIGLDITVKEKLGHNEYVATTPEKGKVRKQVTYFLGESAFVDIVLEEKGGLDDAKWFKLSSILDLNFYNDILPIITNAINILVRRS